MFETETYVKEYPVDTERTSLNLGCGADVRRGFINVDLVSLPGVDLVFNLNSFPWPFANNQFLEIVANHFLEHVDNILDTLGEIWRVGRPGAVIKIRVPYFVSFLAFKDLTHKHRFTYDAFDNWDVRHDTSGRYVTHLNYPMRFRILKRRLLLFSKIKGPLYYLANAPFLIPLLLINILPRLYERFLFFFFPVTNIYYELEIVKPTPDCGMPDRPAERL